MGQVGLYPRRTGVEPARPFLTGARSLLAELSACLPRFGGLLELLALRAPVLVLLFELALLEADAAFPTPPFRSFALSGLRLPPPLPFGYALPAAKAPK